MSSPAADSYDVDDGNGLGPRGERDVTRIAVAARAYVLARQQYDRGPGTRKAESDAYRTLEAAVLEEAIANGGFPPPNR